MTTCPRILGAIATATIALLVGFNAQAEDCRVADPTGTPLNIRTVPDGKTIVGTLKNGAPVRILDTKDKWAYIGLLPEENKTIVPTGWVYREYLDCAARIPSTTAAYADSKNPIGWMKTSDIGCGVVEGTEVCNPIDHYTDAYQRGEDCATYGVPFYDRPNGKPIGLLWGEAQIILGEKSNDGKYTRIWSKSDLKDVGIMPYSLKALHECG